MGLRSGKVKEARPRGKSTPKYSSRPLYMCGPLAKSQMIVVGRRNIFTRRKRRVEVEPQVALAQAPHASHTRRPLLPPLWLLSALALVLFVWTANRNLADVNGYHCYALAFWGGRSAAATLPGASAPVPLRSCLVALSTFPAAPFHALPLEYGPLALLVFLPPLILPMAWYNTGFFIEMALVAVALAWLLHRYGAPGSGHVWLVYALIGSMVLTAGRFDTLPATCVVIALIAARQGKLKWAYAALAVGTMLKLYPAALLPLLLIESWRARERELLWRGPAIFVAIVAVTETLATLINPASPMTPLSFMGARCVQVESMPAMLSALWAQLTGAHITYPYAYNSDCLQTTSTGAFALIAQGASLVGMALVFAQYWRRRLTLVLTAALTLALLILGSKVFSPQFLLWVSPLVAFEYGADAAVLLGWGSICLTTTLCFPLAYEGKFDPLLRQPTEIAVTLAAGVRNFAFTALTGAMLWRTQRNAPSSVIDLETP